MIKLFINGLAASAGGGLTYLRNVIPQLAKQTDVETTVLVNPAICHEFDGFPNLSFVQIPKSRGAGVRFLSEQAALPKLILRSGAQILISTGNFALWRSPVPQILLSRNALYTSAGFLRDARARRDYTIWADTHIKGWLARLSIGRADVTVAPSVAFAEELRRWTGANVLAIHHGFDPLAFTSDPTPLPESVQRQLGESRDALRLLFVSHYNYYRNFETLFRALPVLSSHLKGREVRLMLTCNLDSSRNPGSYRAESAAALVKNLKERENIVELGSIPYRSVHHLYRACHIYVTPAYAESFAHPLVESMASGLPVAASDLPVHREICGDAAVYFPRFSPEGLAEAVLRISESPSLAQDLSCNGLKRAQDFSWENHVEDLLTVARQLIHASYRS